MLCSAVLRFDLQCWSVLCCAVLCCAVLPSPTGILSHTSCKDCQAGTNIANLSAKLDSTHAQQYDQLVNCYAAVLEDMLWGFMGFEGKYIKADRARSSKAGVSFVLKGKLDAAVHELVARMLPIWYACQLYFAPDPVLMSTPKMRSPKMT